MVIVNRHHVIIGKCSTKFFRHQVFKERRAAAQDGHVPHVWATHYTIVYIRVNRCAYPTRKIALLGKYVPMYSYRNGGDWQTVSSNTENRRWLQTCFQKSATECVALGHHFQSLSAVSSSSNL